MTHSIRFLKLAIITALILSACTISSTPTPVPPEAVQPILPTATPVSTLILTVSADTSVPFNAVGQVINYTYRVNNIGGEPFPGPVTIVDTKTIPTCPEILTLNANEEVVCTGSYAIAQVDLDAGSVTNNSTATVGGSNSATITTTVMLSQAGLTLSKTADPQTYINLGEAIIYSYTITNTGNLTLGPAQFSINDNKISSPFNCGSDATSLVPNAIVTCSATYTITQADLDAGIVTNTASATGGGATSNSVSTTINKAPSISTPLPPSTDLVPGSTISHKVVKDEWLWQIARCYGADPRKVIQANSQLYDPARISPDMTVTVPNIGSERDIYGPPCVPAHTVVSGETWESIAQQYNASPSLLQHVNLGVTLSPGSVLRVPINSVGDK